jgi:flavin-dependent dehydrogenase
MTSSDLYDVAVIGGGPAGCAAAITARRAGARVLLLERGKYPRPKVCGEFVSSEALELLRKLLGDDNSLLDSASPVTSARIFIDCQIITAKVEPRASSIPRFDMDHALWRAAEQAGVHALQQSPVQRIEGGNTYTLSTADQRYSARTVINASGRWSNLRANSRETTKGPKWIGIKAHFVESSPAKSVDLYFFPGGYCGVQPVSDSEINVCAMVRADVSSTLPEVFECEPRLLERSRQWKQIGEAVSTSPLIHAEPSPVNDAVLYVGDAAGFIDPFVGDGISMGLHSGQMAATALHSFFNGNANLSDAAQSYAAEYRQKLLPAFRNAARARKLVSAPQFFRRAALSLMNFPGISELVVRQTRARIV